VKASLPAFCLGLILIASSSISGPAHAKGILSLDLCSDWLAAHFASRDSVITLSPMAVRHPPPWSDRGWPTHDGSLEQILALRPELVIVGAFNAPLLRQRLASLGFQVVVLDQVADLIGLASQIKRLLEAINRLAGAPPERADQLSASTALQTGPPLTASGRESQAAGTRATTPRGRLLLLGPNGYGTGPGTFEAALIEAAGWRNHIERPGHHRLDLESLTRTPPDAILWTSPPGPALANRFAQHRALARAVPMERWLKTDYWRWQCPGPWSLDLIRQLQP